MFKEMLVKAILEASSSHDVLVTTVMENWREAIRDLFASFAYSESPSKTFNKADMGSWEEQW